MSEEPLLQAEGLRTGYAGQPVLFGIDLALEAGEVLALIGRNGMGKTTLVRTIFGLLPVWDGHVRLRGADVSRLPPHARARAGLGLVPEGRQIFPNLTVEENLLATARPPAAGGDGAAPGWTLSDVYALFPELAERRQAMGSLLSGGEQQMLAIARALMTNPRVMVLDEATEGLAPLVRRRIWQAIAELAGTGLSLLIIDRDLAALAPLASRLAVMQRGRIVWQGAPAEFVANSRLMHRYLGLGEASSAEEP
jgi:branched-chain amino acid transport system ATP-binding protein